MREEIARRMATARRGDLPGRYWYPLATANYGPDEVMAVVDTLCEFRTTMGETTREFEYAFAEWVGADHAVMVNSGSSADLLIAFSALEHPGREVLIPAVTWPTHVWSWLMAGFHVTLVDCDPSTLNIDAGALEKAAEQGPIRADILSLVHLMGAPSDNAGVTKVARDWQLDVYEDCCEALGADVGCAGIAASWSFFFSHHMTTLEGGMITTFSADLAEQLRLLRAHGWSRNLRHPPPVPKDLDPRYAFLDWGFNVRPTEQAAAFGMVQLGKLEAMNTARQANYEVFAEAMTGVHGVRLPTTVGETNPMTIPMMVRDRDRVAAHLDANGVETRRIVAGNLARHPAARRHGLAHDPLPGADEIHNHGMVLGLHPVVARDEILRVAALVKEAV